MIVTKDNDILQKILILTKDTDISAWTKKSIKAYFAVKFISITFVNSISYPHTENKTK